MQGRGRLACAAARDKYPQSFLSAETRATVDEVLNSQDGDDAVALMPADTPLALEPTNNIFGMPEDCMYGWLADAARKLHTPLSMAYPAMLAVASGTKPVDRRGHVRSNLYVALLGGTGSGKSVTMKRAQKLLLLPERVLDKGIVASERGLIKRLGNRDGGAVLLSCSELLILMLKAKIENSALSPCLCDLFDDDIASISDKTHTDECNACLSILGALKCDDALDFSRIFGTGTGAGFADRFILGLCPPGERHEYKDLDFKGDFRFPKGVTVERWCFERVNAWRKANPDGNRSRLGEIALRVALVSD